MNLPAPALPELSVPSATVQLPSPGVRVQAQAPQHIPRTEVSKNLQNVPSQQDKATRDHTPECVKERADYAIATAFLVSCEGANCAAATRPPPCVCSTGPDNNLRVGNVSACTSALAISTRKWEDDPRVVQFPRHAVGLGEVAVSRPAVGSLVNAPPLGSTSVVSKVQATINRARRIAQPMRSTPPPARASLTAGAPGQKIRTSASGETPRPTPGPTARITRIDLSPGTGGHPAQAYGSPGSVSSAAQPSHGRPTITPVSAVSAVPHAQAQVQTQRSVPPSQTHPQAPMRFATTPSHAGASTPGHASHHTPPEYNPPAAAGQPTVLACQTSVSDLRPPTQALARTTTTAASGFVRPSSTQPAHSHTRFTPPVRPVSQPSPTPPTSGETLAANAVSGSSTTLSPAPLRSAMLPSPKLNQTLTPVQLSQMALANPRVPPKPAPFECVSPAWLMLGPMPPPPPDRNKGMVGGKPVQPAPKVIEGNANSVAPCPVVVGKGAQVQQVQTLAPQAPARSPVVQAPSQAVQAPPTQLVRVPSTQVTCAPSMQPDRVASMRVNYATPVQLTRAPSVQAAPGPFVQAARALAVQPARAPSTQLTYPSASQPTQRARPQTPQGQGQTAPRGQFTYTQAPAPIHHAVPRTVPAQLTRTSSMTAIPQTVADANGSFSVAAWTGAAQPVPRAQSFHGFPQSGSYVHPVPRASRPAGSPGPPTMGHAYPVASGPSGLKRRVHDDEIQEIPPPRDAKRFKRH